MNTCPWPSMADDDLRARALALADKATPGPWMPYDQYEPDNLARENLVLHSDGALAEGDAEANRLTADRDHWRVEACRITAAAIVERGRLRNLAAALEADVAQADVALEADVAQADVALAEAIEEVDMLSGEIARLEDSLCGACQRQ